MHERLGKKSSRSARTAYSKADSSKFSKPKFNNLKFNSSKLGIIAAISQFFNGGLIKKTILIIFLAVLGTIIVFRIAFRGVPGPKRALVVITAEDNFKTRVVKKPQPVAQNILAKLHEVEAINLDKVRIIEPYKPDNHTLSARKINNSSPKLLKEYSLQFTTSKPYNYAKDSFFLSNPNLRIHVTNLKGKIQYTVTRISNKKMLKALLQKLASLKVNIEIKKAYLPA